MSNNSPATRSYQFELPVDAFLQRQDAIFLAAAKALGCAGKEIYQPYKLFLVVQRASRDRDGQMRLSGSRPDPPWWFAQAASEHQGQVRLSASERTEHCVFLALNITRVRGSSAVGSFKIVLNTLLPAECVEPLLALTSAERGLPEPCKQVDEAGDVFPTALLAEVGQPVTIVDTTPLDISKAWTIKIGALWVPRTLTLRRPSDQLLVLKPFFSRLLALPFILVGGLILFTGLRGAIIALTGANWPPALADWERNPLAMVFLFTCIAGPFFLVLGLLWWIVRRFEFDVGAKRMRTCWDVGAGYSVGTRRERPLTEVLAVQLIKHPGRPRKTTFQLNLVLDGKHQPRMSLTNDSRWEATREAGLQLALFLGVPLLDEIGAEKEGCQ